MNTIATLGLAAVLGCAAGFGGAHIDAAHTGARGPAGIRGPAGNPGVQGKIGLQGKPGSQGERGAPGSQGGTGQSATVLGVCLVLNPTTNAFESIYTPPVAGSSACAPPGGNNPSAETYFISVIPGEASSPGG